MGLRNYQEVGAQWLLHRPRACLADDMGLGKTVTTLHALRLAMAQPLRLGVIPSILFLTPSVVQWNWAREAKVWAPELPELFLVEKRNTELPAYGCTVMSHGMCIDPRTHAQLRARRWDAIVVDEVHEFRGVDSKRGIVLWDHLAPGAGIVWGLTGSPMLKDVSDMWRMFNGLRPDLFPESFEVFRNRYCVVVETRYGPKVVANRKDMLPELRERVRGMITRRKKADYLPELPPLEFVQITLRPKSMPTGFAAIEKRLSKQMKGALDQMARGGATPEQVFRAMGEGEQWSRWLLLCGLAKANASAELLSMELAQNDEKVVVFAHHKEVVGQLCDKLKAFGVRRITGATPAKQRDENIQAFQTDPSVRVIVCNIKAGGVGATLTAAAEVVFVELSGIPGYNAQAADRIRRIGQTRQCRVRFIALAGTSDEQLVPVIRQRAKMITEVLD